MPDRFGEIPIHSPQSSSVTPKVIKRSPSSPVKPDKEPAPGRMRIWGWGIGVILVFALYSCLGFLGVPYYLTEILPKTFSDKTGLALDPGSIKFNPLTFRLEVEKMLLASPSGAPIISFSSLETDLAPLSLLRRDMVSNAVTIQELDLNLIRELDGSYNIAKLLGSKNVNEGSEIINFSDLPFFFSLNNISIQNSRVVFNDIPTKKRHTIEEIQLALPTFSNIPFQADQYLRPQFSAVINGSPIELTGQAHMGEPGDEGKATNLSCDILNLDLPLYSGYLPFELPFQFQKGKADGKIELFFDPREEKGKKLSIGFELQILGAELQSENNSLILAVPTARLSGKLQPVSRTLVFDSIALREPSVSSFGKSFGQNISQLMHAKATKTAPGTAGVSPLHLLVDLLIVDDGIVYLFDDKKGKEPTKTWESLQLSVKNYTSKTRKTDVQNSGSFRVSGEKAGTSSYFSWQGTLPGPDSLNGPLTMVKADTNELFITTGQDHPFQVQGETNLKGEFSITLSKGTPDPISYSLKDAEVTIEGFHLIADQKKVITAPIAKLHGLNLENGSFDFGDVFLTNGSVQVSYGRMPDLFTSFSSGRYRLQGIEFDGKATLDHVDKNRHKLVFSNLSLKANELDNGDKTKVNLSISARSSVTGTLKAQGYVQLSPFSLTAKAGFSGLPAKNIFSFFTKSSFLNNIEGELDGKGSFSLPDYSFSGELQLADGSSKISDGSTFFWKKTVLKDVKYSADPFYLGIALIEINNGDFSWLITDKDSDPLQQLAAFFKKTLPHNKRKEAEKRPSVASKVDIQQVIFSEGEVHIQDSRLQPKWLGEVIGLAGTIQDIHSAESTGKSAFTFTGLLDDSPFTIQGAVNLFSPDNNGAIHFILEQYPLASYHEQLTPKVDANTSVGEFDLTLDSTWQDGRYHSSGVLLLADIEPVSKTSNSALPLALLNGPDNIYHMNFDFSSSIPVAQTVLFEELLSQFQTLIVKGSVSPLLLATDNFNDLIGNEFAEFRPGEFMLSDRGREVLTLYTALLIAHPHIGLELSGGVDREIDEQAMRSHLEAIELKRIENENKKLFDKWQTQKDLYEKKLLNRQNNIGPGGNYGDLEIPDDVLLGFTPLQPEPVVVSEAMLLELAEKRVDVLYQHFTTQLTLQPEQIVIAQSNGIAPTTGSPANRVDIALRAVDR